jgi:hypothetical protein
MTILYINTGTSPNAGDGDSIRLAFTKVNANFTYLSTASFSGGVGPRGPTGPQGSASRVTISNTAPIATTGTQWFSSVNGRTYVAYNGQWVDASPAFIPTPSTYLDDIEIDGSTLYINSSTLTINNSGTLLVNGTEVTAPTVNTYLQNLFYN